MQEATVTGAWRRGSRLRDSCRTASCATRAPQQPAASELAPHAPYQRIVRSRVGATQWPILSKTVQHHSRACHLSRAPPAQWWGAARGLRTPNKHGTPRLAKGKLHLTSSCVQVLPALLCLLRHVLHACAAAAYAALAWRGCGGSSSVEQQPATITAGSSAAVQQCSSAAVQQSVQQCSRTYCRERGSVRHTSAGNEHACYTLAAPARQQQMI